ncbi:unnamed protein product, partial [Polarella glacialis]
VSGKFQELLASLLSQHLQEVSALQVQVACLQSQQQQEQQQPQQEQHAENATFKSQGLHQAQQEQQHQQQQQLQPLKGCRIEEEITKQEEQQEQQQQEQRQQQLQEITGTDGYPLNAPSPPTRTRTTTTTTSGNRDAPSPPTRTRTTTTTSGNRRHTARSATQATQASVAMTKMLSKLEADDVGVEDFFHGGEDEDEDLIWRAQDTRADVEPLSRFKRLEVFLQSSTFDVSISILLCANLVFLAAELQYSGLIQGYRMAFYSSPIIDEELWPTSGHFFEAGYQVFTWLFAVEVFIRICVLRCKFWHVAMNCFDFVVVAASVIAQLSEGTLPIPPAVLRLLRIVKISRAFRLSRALRSSSVLQSLQMLLNGISASVEIFVWCFAILVFIQCIAGLIISSLTRDIMQDANADILDLAIRKDIFKYYGTFSRTFLTMFEILFANWAPACRILVENVNEWFAAFFLVYRCLVGFAVVNVVSAVCVQQTMKTAALDAEHAFKQKQKDQRRYTQKVKKLFQSVDVSGDGNICFEEFSLLVASPKLKFWVAQLELEKPDLVRLFELLEDGTGEISMDHFIEGATRLKNSAKMIDIWRLETKMEQMLSSDGRPRGSVWASQQSRRLSLTDQQQGVASVASIG